MSATKTHKTKEKKMTKNERFRQIDKMARERGFIISFGGYTQSKRGNETLFKVHSADLLLKKGTIKEIKTFLNNVPVKN